MHVIKPPRCSRVAPENEFLDRLRTLKLWKSRKMDGILPEILFRDKSMLCSIFNALMLAWRFPSNELNDKFKNNRFSRLHKLDGIDEDNEFEPRNMICK